MKLSGCLVLVTGGAHRLGGHISRCLAARGAHIAIHCNSHVEAAEDLAAQFRLSGSKSLVFPMDLSQPEAPEALADAILEKMGPPSIVIHNAAVMPRGSLLNTDQKTLESTLTVNLMAPILLTRALKKGLIAQKGQVVFMGDIAGEQGWPPFGAHSVSKAGLLMANQLLAQEFAPDVRVNLIAPGTVLPARGQRPIISKVPLKRVGSPEDILKALLYVLDADFVTGEVLHVDGGRLARRI